MPVVTSAIPPSTLVTEIPGRFCPAYVIDKRTMTTLANTTASSVQLAFLPRTETIDATFNTPTQEVDELGTNFHVGYYDDLPEAKLSVSSYDTGYNVVSLLTGKNAPVGATTTYGFNDFNTANADVIRQFADPNGNVFASMFQGDMIIDEFGFALKSKSAAMETYALAGFNLMKFRGFIQTKAYKIVAGDVSTPLSGVNYGFSISSMLGSSEAPVALPVPTGSQPPSYWIQNGCYTFLKAERWRSGVGFKRFPEASAAVTSAPGTQVAVGSVLFNSTTSQMYVNSSDLAAGDIWLLTYCTYATNARIAQLATPGVATLTPSASGGTLAAGTTYNYRISALDAFGETLAGVEAAAATTTGSTSSIAISWTAVAGAVSYNVYGRTTGAELKLANVTGTTYTDIGTPAPSGALPAANTTGGSFATIYQNTPDSVTTGDAIAVPTRLTPFTISGNNIPRGQSLDAKMQLKRDRAEGIGDTSGLWGPSASPQVTISLEVKATDFGLNAILETGSPLGTDTTGTKAGDFYDPNYATRVQLTSAVPLIATINDPRSAGTVIKTYTLPTMVLNNENLNTSVKNPVTVKYTGMDKTGNLTVSITR